jgi:hypothetical protein
VIVGGLLTRRSFSEGGHPAAVVESLQALDFCSSSRDIDPGSAQ